MGPIIECLLNDIETLVQARWNDASLGERAGAYAALKVCAADLREHLEKRGIASGYAGEKLFKVVHHTAGTLGYGERAGTGFTEEQERQFALGHLSTLRSVVRDAFAGVDN